jgi:hypothetical protein
MASRICAQSPPPDRRVWGGLLGTPAEQPMPVPPARNPLSAAKRQILAPSPRKRFVVIELEINWEYVTDHMRVENASQVEARSEARRSEGKP